MDRIDTASIRFWALLIAVVTLIAYAPTFHNGFVWDDSVDVIHNKALESVEGLKAFWTHPPPPLQFYPVTFTCFWIEHYLWGLNPIGYHIVGVLLHILNAILVGVLLSRLAVPGAWVAAVVFAVHPVHVESVAWIAERKNVLSGFFYLCALLVYLRFDSSRRWRTYGCAFALFLCAMLSKTVVATFPCVVLLIFWWKRERIEWRDFWPLIPFFAMGVALGPVSAHLEKAAGAEWSYSFLERFLRAGHAIWFYAGKIVWPHPLIFIYPRWLIHVGAWQEYLWPAAVIAVVSLLWFVRARGALVAVLFFLGTIAPALGFLNVFFMRYAFVADHFQYLASIGLIALATAGGATLVKQRNAQWGVAGVLVFVLAMLTWRHSVAFRNNETIWRDTIANDPNSWMAHNNLATILFDRGDLLEAVEHHTAALRAKPDDAPAHNELGLSLLRLRRSDEAVGHFREALRLCPDDAGYHNNLGVALINAGKIQEATAEYAEAVRLKPNDAGKHFNLAFTLVVLGRTGEAVDHYRQAIRLNANWPQPKRALAWILATDGRARIRNGPEAVGLAESACRESNFGDAASLDALAAAYAEVGRFNDAVLAARRALEISETQPEFAAAIRKRVGLYEAGQPYRELQTEVGLH